MTAETLKSPLKNNMVFGGNMKYTIDRFEGDYAVLEDENCKINNILKKALPSGAKEGDILTAHIDGSYTIEQLETTQRKEHISKLLDELMEH
jgi:hypothetical protein